MSKGIAGYVATSGKTVNLANVYEDPRFNPEIDILNKYKTVSMLCVPLFGPDKSIIGVASLINKTDPDEKINVFTDEDLKQFEDIAVFCGLALHKALMKQKIEEQRHRLAITMEIMSYHGTVKPDDVESFKNRYDELKQPIEKIQNWQFDSHIFSHSDDHLAIVAHQLFTSLSYPDRFDILDDNLLHYILVVRHNYRPVAYHNFSHAVSVTHAVYTWIVNGALDPYMDQLELFSMLVAALNHDIDHRGTNNQFQKMAQTELSQFYQSSTMERHHFNHAMAILNSSQGLNILAKLSKKDYKRALKIIESSIMSTDLALFLSNQVSCINQESTQSFVE